MFTYAVRRVGVMILVLWAVSTLVFGIMRLSGDPVVHLVTESATQEEIDQLRAQMGLNRPLYVQYGDFLVAAATGDFGESFRFRQPALALVLERLPVTMKLALVATVVAVGVAVPAGVTAALNRGNFLDGTVMSGALLGLSMPVFWLGILLIMVFAAQLRWFPSGGADTWQHFVLPGIALGAYSMARIARLVRSGMLEVLQQAYVQTARAKGLAERIVIYKHCFKNASLPVITMLGIEMGTLLGGAVITETVFSMPGLGRLAVQAINYRDYPLTQATVLYIALTFVILNAFVDLSYGWLDPRISYD